MDSIEQAIDAYIDYQNDVVKLAHELNEVKEAE